MCISDFTRSQLMAVVGEDQWHKLHVVRCGIEPTAYDRVGEPPAGRPRVLCVGRLVPEKGQSVLLHAFARLADRGVDAELELVGYGPAENDLKRLAERLGLADRVIFAGAVGQDAIGAHYEAASVFCLPSFWEGIPVVLMEALACRRPVIATAVAGVRELVREGKTGLLVSPAARTNWRTRSSGCSRIPRSGAAWARPAVATSPTATTSIPRRSRWRACSEA